MSNERAPTLAEVLQRHLDAFGEDFHVSIPAVVTDYDAAAQRASCKPLVRRAYYDETGARQTESVPVVPGVPVLFPGTGVFRITFPISDGHLVIGGQTLPATTGLLVFADRSIDKWLTGGAAEVDPEIDHQHALTDAVFLPGLNAFGAVPEASAADHIALGQVAGNDWVALAGKVHDTLARLQSVLNTLFSSAALGTPVVEPGNGAPSALQAALIAALESANITGVSSTWPDSVAALQVKAK